MFDDWIRATTIFSEPSQEPGDLLKHLEQLREQVAMVAAVNQPGKISIKLQGPVTDHDQQALAEGLAAMNTIRSRQAWINHVIEAQLIAGLAEATGQTRFEIIQRLAIELGSVFHPTHRSDPPPRLPLVTRSLPAPLVGRGASVSTRRLTRL